MECAAEQPLHAAATAGHPNQKRPERSANAHAPCYDLAVVCYPLYRVAVQSKQELDARGKYVCRTAWIERIRDRIRLRQYDMTAHATEEMAEDDLDIADVEHAVLTGRVVQIRRGDRRGNKYVLEGTATDGTSLVGVVGRFPRGDRFLIVTAYKVS